MTTVAAESEKIENLPTIEREERRKREIVIGRVAYKCKLYSYHHNPPKRTLTNIKTCIEAVFVGLESFNRGVMQPTIPQGKASHYRPLTVGNQARKKNFRYGTVSFTLSFFFLVGSDDGGGSSTRDGHGEFSKGKSGRGMEKSEKVKKCVAK